MRNNESVCQDPAEAILDQLLKFTTQLAAAETDPEVDVKAISEACAGRIEDLKRLLPNDLRGSPVANKTNHQPPDSKLIDKIRDLHSRTKTCLEILERKKTRAAAGMHDLSRTKQAITAYGR